MGVPIPRRKDKRIRSHVTAMALAVAALCLCSPTIAAAQSADSVLVVINDSNPTSVRIGSAYAEARRVPAGNLVRIQTRDTDTISRADYESTIEAPIGAWLSRHLLQDQILYIVLTKGIPLRVEGTGGQAGTIASVDSELTLLYRKLTGAPVSRAGRLDNPYFLGDKPLPDARHFSRQDSDLYLVTRLDGFTADDVLRLIDRGMHPSSNGRIVLDQKATMLDRGGDAWLEEAAARLRGAGQGARVLFETTKAVAATDDPVLGYFSWGSNDPANQLRKMGLTFVPGAIGGLFVSTDGRTFREPAPDWRPALAGSLTGGQSLAGDLIREGLTGVSAHVAEPYLDAIVRPQILFPAYLAGFNLAESFYLSMPYLSWQDLVIGDPLCAPFAAAAGIAGASSVSGSLDPETGLPTLFARRALAVLGQSGAKPAALPLLLKAQSLQAQQRPEAEVRALLERATAIDARLPLAQMQLAQFAEARNDWADAIARYRALVAADPGNVVALNNLAYALADKLKVLDDALPFAERAYKLAPQVATIGDTLGWIHYLRGDLQAARPLIDRAAQAEPANVDILVHAAAVALALNDPAKAKGYLAAAVKVDPKTDARPDVKALRAKLGGGLVPPATGVSGLATAATPTL